MTRVLFRARQVSRKAQTLLRWHCWRLQTSVHRSTGRPANSALSRNCYCRKEPITFHDL